MIKKIGHIALVLLLLVTTMGVKINLHYCQHTLYDIGIFGEAENCCKPTVGCCKANTDKHSHTGNKENHTCKDETVFINAVDNFIVSGIDIKFDDLKEIQLFEIPTISGLFESYNYKKSDLFEYNIHPPGTSVVLSKLQTYLI